MIEFDEDVLHHAKIKVIGVGGAGGNAINTMIQGNLEGVAFIAANTDMQALQNNYAPIKLHLGANLTRGLGAGADPEVGRNAALESEDQIRQMLTGSDMVFITAGMGGGTGTGGAPIVAKIAKELGILTVGVVTKPFDFEGKRRKRQAEEGSNALRSCVDTLITIPNQRLVTIADQHTSLIEMFRKADLVLLNAVKGISDLITVPGIVNVDFADVKSIMSNMGLAIMGTGCSSGENRSLDAVKQAISSPLLQDLSIHGATGILINITGGKNLTLFEINEASSLIQTEADEDANIIFGSVIDDSMDEEIKITVIATGFDRQASKREPRPIPSAKTEKPSRSSNDSIDTNIPTAVHHIATPIEVPYTRHKWDKSDLDFPSNLASDNSFSAKELPMLNPIDEEEIFDIPTFLRKQAD